MSPGSCEPGETTEPLPQAAADDFVELFTSQYPRLVGVLRISGAGTAAEDLAQEAFARTLGHWKRVREGTNPAGYLYRVAFNLLKRRVGLAEDPLGDIDPPSAGPGPEEAAIATVGAAAALDAMPPRRRACAALVWQLGFTSDEAGAILGIDGATVRTQLERARRAAAPLISSR
ncbi:MAG: polymerase, sigma-24 subunit, subfamily [Acidimicrobiales bacterium]|nr:polymerase, sigma-24 subunit, subfamily [Acidimicrobiales bacterium]